MQFDKKKSKSSSNTAVEEVKECMPRVDGLHERTLLPWLTKLRVPLNSPLGPVSQESSNSIL